MILLNTFLKKFVARVFAFFLFMAAPEQEMASNSSHTCQKVLGYSQQLSRQVSNKYNLVEHLLVSYIDIVHCETRRVGKYNDKGWNVIIPPIQVDIYDEIYISKFTILKVRIMKGKYSDV